MKYLTIIVVAIMVCLPLIACTNTPDVPMVAFATVTQIEKLQIYIDTGLASKGNKADVDSIIARINTAEQKINQSAAPNLTNYYTKAEVDAAVAKAITDYKATIGGSTGTQTPSNPTGVTGQVSIAIINAQQWNSFNPSGIVALKIINNKSEARYVRPQVTFNVFPSSSTAAVLVSSTCVVTSNSQGQPPIIFTPTPVTAWATCSQILFIPTSGGMNSAGQYLVSSGGSMDIYLTITLNPGFAGLWTITASETDVSMVTGT